MIDYEQIKLNLHVTKISLLKPNIYQINSTVFVTFEKIDLQKRNNDSENLISEKC